jgi:hypothetical protein
MSRDPVEPHNILGRDIIQHLLALLNQQRCCSSGLKWFQCSLTVGACTYMFLSGILSEGCLPGGFLFAANAVSLKFLIHNSRMLRLGTLSFWWILKCQRNVCWVRTTESLFLKYVSTAKALCPTDQHSIATEILWIWLEGCSKINSPRQHFHSHLCCQTSGISAGPCTCDRKNFSLLSAGSQWRLQSECM